MLWAGEVPPELRGRAITFIFLGWSLASVLGMPLGAVRELVSLGLKVRTDNRLKVRQPLSRADVILARQELKDRVAVYKELITQCPESPEALEGRVVLAELLRVHFRDLRGAIDQLTAALARNPPQGAELHYQVAKLYFELQDYQQCVLESRKLVERFATSAFVDDAIYLQAQALHMPAAKRSTIHSGSEPDTAIAAVSTAVSSNAVAPSRPAVSGT